MDVSLKLISLNIERSKHLDLVLPFLEKQNADVVCAQELMESDIPPFEKMLGTRCVFAPMTRYSGEDVRAVMGVGIFSALPITHTIIQYYRGDPSRIPNFDIINAETKSKTQNHPIIFCDLEKNGSMFRIGTTHFTWTPDGQPNDFQRADMQKMLAILDSSQEFVLAGDFNAPRGREIFSMLAAQYKDNIPAQYETSIDEEFHRSGLLKLMVDGIFSTPAYRVSEVELVSGISDHCALAATVSKSIA